MLEIGTVLENTYRITRFLGRGGTAMVFAAEHTRLHREFAIKIITSELGNDRSCLERCKREAEILSSLSHPHLVHIRDWNQTPQGYPYIVMERLEGEDLETRLARAGRLPPELALAIFRQTADALAAGHERGIIHRDIKPGNIFLCSDRTEPYVKLLDFGIAKLLHETAQNLTLRSTVLGTPAYMSPEQALAGEVDSASDQWSLAIVLYEMLAGPPFYRPGDSPLVTLRRVVEEEIVPLARASREPGLGRIEQALVRALSKDPRARWRSLAEFVQATGATGGTAPQTDSVPAPRPSAEAPARAAASQSTESLPPSGEKRAPARTVHGSSLRWLQLGLALCAVTTVGRLLSTTLLRAHSARARTDKGAAAHPLPPPAAVQAAQPTPVQSEPAHAEPRPVAPHAIESPRAPLVSVPTASQLGPSLVALSAPPKPRLQRAARLTSQPTRQAEPHGWVVKVVSGADSQQAPLIEACIGHITPILSAELSAIRLTLQGYSALRILPHAAVPPQYRSRANTCLEEASRVLPLPTQALVLVQPERRKS